MNTTQPVEVDQVGPAAARVYRLGTEDDVELAITRLGSEAEENTGEPVILVHHTNEPSQVECCLGRHCPWLARFSTNEPSQRTFPG